VGRVIFCTTQQLHYPFADVAVLNSKNTSDKKSIVHTLSLKKGFLWGIYKKRTVIASYRRSAPKVSKN